MRKGGSEGGSEGRKGREGGREGGREEGTFLHYLLRDLTMIQCHT